MNCIEVGKCNIFIWQFILMNEFISGNKWVTYNLEAQSILFIYSVLFHFHVSPWPLSSFHASVSAPSSVTVTLSWWLMIHFINHLTGSVSGWLSVKSAEHIRRWGQPCRNTSIVLKGVCDQCFLIMWRASNRRSFRAILTPRLCQRESWEFYIFQAVWAPNTPFP